ncbi:MAG: hypothetical protein HRU20_09070 [Pseudomonadales bacterium]|nr:hypothetical protein [Pseudomonadales bacterium]
MLNHVVVIGGGFSGMVYTAAIAPYCQKITVLDAGVLVFDTPQYRAGVPQDRHQHTLLLKGRQILQQLIPDFEARLDELNVPETDYIDDCLLFTHGGKLPRFPSRVKIRPCLRPTLDWVITQHVIGLENVELRENTRVKVLDIVNATVKGVKVSGAKSETEEIIGADLVLDCSGRQSKMPKWLEECGIAAPKLSKVVPHLGYASCLYQKPPSHSAWKGVEVACHAPDNPRAAGLWEVENNQWLLTLIGTAKNFPGNKPEEFLDFAKQLSTPVIYDAIADLEPISAIRTNRGTDNQWYHYEKMNNLPSGLLVCGDAHCCFNPYYGQGMTIVAITAKLLADNLKKSSATEPLTPQQLDKLRKSYYRKSFRYQWVGWTMATFEDARWPTTEGLKLRWYEKLFFKYLDTVLAVSLENDSVAKRCVEIANMTIGVQHIVHPYLLIQCLKKMIAVTNNENNYGR